MDATKSLGVVWSGPALSNPNNVSIRGWKRGAIVDQTAEVQKLLRDERFLRASRLQFVTEDGTIVGGSFDWDHSAHRQPEAGFCAMLWDENRNKHSPAASWRQAFRVTGNFDNGTFEVERILVAPNRLSDEPVNPYLVHADSRD